MAAITGQTVADFLGQGNDASLVTLAEKSADVVTQMARAYTRDGGFTANVPNSEIGAVITTAAARLVANPEQLGTTVGTLSVRGSFNGWTLAERLTLNRYRKKAQ